MRFEFRREDSLPRLAWWARLREGDDRAALLHGPWVCRPAPLEERLGFAGMRVLYSLLAAVVKQLNKLGDRFAWKTVFSPALHGRYSSAVHPFRFTFHWGIERIKSRYGVRE